MSLEAKLKESHGEDLDEVDDIEELNLDGLVSISKISDSDKKYLERFTNLVSLSASGLQLTTVDNFPNLPSLKTLSLNDNKIEGDLSPLTIYPELKSLELENNQISNVDDLAPLKQLKSLRQILLNGCPLADKDDYRDQIFELLPDLELVDRFNKDGEEVSEDEEEGDEEKFDEEEGSEEGDESDEEAPKKKHGQDKESSEDEYEDDDEEEVDVDDEEEEENESDEGILVCNGKEPPAKKSRKRGKK